MAFSPYKTSLLKKRNLDDLTDLYLEELKAYNELIIDGVEYSNEKITKKKDMKIILEEIKLPFYALTKLNPIKDPKILIKSENNYLTSTKLFYTDKLTIGLLTGVSILTGGLPLLIGASLTSSILTAGVAEIGILGLFNSFIYLKQKESIKNPIAFHSENSRIFIPRAYKESLNYIIAHEFIHDINLKYNLSNEDPFIDEGVTTATALKVMDVLGEKELSNRYFSLKKKITNIISTIYLITGKSFNLFGELKQDVNFALELQEYTLGATMVHLAEKKYGEEIYPELFKGNYDCLIF